MAKSQPITNQRGVSLIEVLVSVLILSIGILGMISLQATSLKVSHQSHYQTEAMHLLNSISDRIRANPEAAEDGSFTLALTTRATNIAKDCSTNDCNATELAAYDLSQWRNGTINSSLPVAGVRIAADDASAPTSYNITIMWDPAREGVTGTQCGGGTGDGYDPSQDKHCLQLAVQL